MWREAVSRNVFFRQSRKPFVIGIAGDSGAGKDTLANAITGLFGDHSVAKLSGDNYHIYDRKKPLWKIVTHLNPMANDIERFCCDLIRLADGKSVQSRHYDHKTGRSGKASLIKSNDIIIASGLHALYLPILRECYSLSIFLDIDEDLRRYFKLKRDVSQRGHSLDQVLASFKKRESDSVRFIQIQSKFADLTFSLQPTKYQVFDNLEYNHTPHLKLNVKTRKGFNEHSLSQFLVGVCGLNVDLVIGDEVQITIEGDISAANIELAANSLCKLTLDFLDISPLWQDGMVGLMQLITLSQINQIMIKRMLL